MTTTTNLPLPKRDRTHLSLVQHTKAQMSLWVSNLPIMNAAESGKQLYQTITELSALEIDEVLRFELLDILQPTIHKLILTLEKHFLNQSLLLPIQGRRVFALVLALRTNVALNYKIIAIQTLQKLQGRVGFMNLGRGKAQKLAATAIQRTMAEWHYLLLDHYRQYEEAPTGIWSNIHTLCRVAEAQGLMDIACKTSIEHQQLTTIRRTYLSIILLAASGINKLRPAEMELVSRYSYEWAEFLTLNTTASDSLLVCHLDDSPPLYHHRVATGYDSWYIHSQRLAAHFQTLNAASTGTLSVSLINHLYNMWSTNRERMFDRPACRKPILLCLGMSSAHYYVGKETAFKQVVKGEEIKQEVKQPTFLFGLDEEDPLKDQPDAWQICYGTVSSIDSETTDDDLPAVPAMTYMPYRVTAENRCPGGYGIVWADEPPLALRVGELIGMSEQRGQGWGIGVLHWLRQNTQGSFEAGIELLAAHPKPCGVCLLNNKQVASDYMRGFLIPEMRSLDQPASMITPSSGLSVESMVKISLNGQEVTVKLTKQILATQSVSQFEFAVLAETTESYNLDDTDTFWARL